MLPITVVASAKRLSLYARTIASPDGRPKTIAEQDVYKLWAFSAHAQVLEAAIPQWLEGTVMKNIAKLIDLGAASAETKGPIGPGADEVLARKPSGLSND